jgi:class 3 adenylate cyclase
VSEAASEEIFRLRAEVERLTARLSLYEGQPGKSLSVTPASKASRSVPGVEEMILETDSKGRRVRHVNSAFAAYFGVDAAGAVGRPVADVDRAPFAPGVLSTLLGEARQSPGYVVEWRHESLDAATNRPRHLVFRAQVASDGGSVVVVDETRLRLLETYFRRLVSPHLLEQLVEQPGDWFACRSVDVSVVVFDLYRFEAAALGLAPERIAGALGSYYVQVTGAVQQASGTVCHLVGDQATAAFGAPLPLDDHPVRALQAAGAFRARGVDPADVGGGTGVGPLAPRVGVASGRCVAGNLGDERRSEYAVIGPALTMATRLASLAPPGHVFVAPSTVEALRAVVDRRGPEAVPRFALARVKPQDDPVLGRLETYLLR